MKKIRVKVVYRRYKPLHIPYNSFITNPPDSVEFIIPKPIKLFKKFFFVYRKFGNYKLTKFLINIVQKTFFNTKPQSSEVDLLFYVGIIPPHDIQIPYVIDLEHIFLLFNTFGITPESKTTLSNAFTNDLCKKIIPLSNAAKSTLKQYMSETYSKFESKIEVSYPSLPKYTEMYHGQNDYSIVKKDNKFKILSVGKETYAKGIVELLEAFLELYKQDQNIEIYCITDTPDEILEKYSHPGIHFFKSNFTHEDLIKKFFMNCDVFIMPTHSDTFGMVYLDALSSGIPVIATNQFAIPEIIEDGFNGYLINSDSLFLNNKELQPQQLRQMLLKYKGIDKVIVNSIVEKTNLLRNDSNRLAKFKKDAPMLFDPGKKFAINTRNANLTKIFDEALKH